MIQVPPKSLERALAAVKPAVSTRSSIQALSGVRLVADDRLHVQATDMECAVQRLVPDALIGSRTDVVLPHALLLKALKRFAKAPAITITHAEQEATISCGETGQPGHREIRLRTLRREDFPVYDFTAGTPVLIANRDRLADVITRAARFASKDETRPLLTAMVLDLTNVRAPVLKATDSYRLTVMPLHGTVMRGGMFQLPAAGLRKCVKAIKESPDATVEIRTRLAHAHISIGDEVWRMRLIDGQFPNFEQLLPDTNGWSVLDLDRDGLREACKTATDMLTANAPARMACNGIVSLTGVSPDVGSFAEIIEHTWVSAETDITIGFNPDFLADIAAVAPTERVRMSVQKPLRPGLFESDGEKYLLMPIRLNV